MLNTWNLSVSIPSQPEGRELPEAKANQRLINAVSIPSQPEGRELLSGGSDVFVTRAVSIPSQPEGRELLEALVASKPWLKFQSPPSPKAGSYSFQPVCDTANNGFNPLPARRPGATVYRHQKPRSMF